MKIAGIGIGIWAWLIFFSFYNGWGTVALIASIPLFFVCGAIYVMVADWLKHRNEDPYDFEDDDNEKAGEIKIALWQQHCRETGRRYFELEAWLRFFHSKNMLSRKEKEQWKKLQDKDPEFMEYLEWQRSDRMNNINLSHCMNQPNKKISGEKNSRQSNEKIDYFSEKAIGIYILVAAVLVFAAGGVFIDYLPYSYIYAMYVAGFLLFVAIGILADGNSFDISSSSSNSFSNKNRQTNNGKTLFCSGTKQKCSWNGVGYNDDYERGNREIWKNKWGQEAWNDHEYSCSHDDPWDCRDGEHF